MKRTILRKNSTLAYFTQGMVNGRKARYITYIKLTNDGFEVIKERKVSMVNGNNAFRKLLENGYKVVERKVVEA